MSDHVSGQEFTRWMNHLDGRLARIEGKQDTEVSARIELDGRVTAVEQAAEATRRTTNSTTVKLAAGISALATALAQGIAAAFK